MKYIQLTEIEKELNEAAKRKLAEAEQEAIRLRAENNSVEEIPEENTFEWFKYMSIEPPEHLEPKKIINEINVHFNILKDYDFFESRILLERDLIEKVSEWKEFNNACVLYLLSGEEVLVKETLEELETILNKE